MFLGENGEVKDMEKKKKVEDRRSQGPECQRST
ncbi:hypothetical protein PITC_036310 [Penicillium italicum]|uniref:Uncharacterized protein n=1 Tax=Penicillium italicum TaxID=40296 RepID=A0A0A2LGE3_PENIT|nr:hypothetical protein PITC_036310 [Penicillium italicum]